MIRALAISDKSWRTHKTEGLEDAGCDGARIPHVMKTDTLLLGSKNRKKIIDIHAIRGL
jgi:hypothetical protein